MILDQFRLDGKVAMVTGASSILGQGICRGLAEAGADIVGVDYEEMPDTQRQVESIGRKFLGVVSNLLNIEPIQGILNHAVRNFGEIDILVNNAGIVHKADVLDFTEKDWDELMNLNMKTTFFFSQALAKQFIKQNKGGKIINIASILSFHGGIRVSSNIAGKNGIVGLTKMLANEWAKYNININAVAPGYIATNHTIALQENEQKNLEIINKIPAGRWGQPEDIQGAVVFLAVPASNYVNGHILAVDGGWLAR
jgi:2-deoxy-D-gluconate 3-dehydrogenase